MALNTRFDEFLEFPCNFTFKAVGIADEQLPLQVVSAIQQHAPGDYSPQIRASSKGNYHSVSVAVKVTSKGHIETLYQAIAAQPLVRHVL